MTVAAKRLIASVAALQILLYHCWIPVFPYGSFPGNAERFLVSTAYWGVDMFFFLSAFSLVSRPPEDYGNFIRNRAAKLAPLFTAALIAGRFLWFLPSIMVLYLVLPPLYKVCRKNPVLWAFLLPAGWAASVYLVLGIIRPAADFGIFLFRIPSIILGAYAVKVKEKLDPKRALIIGILLLAAGTILICRYGYVDRLSLPFRGTFYLTGIPAMLGTVLILDRLASRGIPDMIGYFGSMTLELYFSQMVLGSFLITALFGLTGSRLLTDMGTLAAVIPAASAIKAVNDGLSKAFGVRP